MNNTLNTFAGFLKGWDAETDRQDRKAAAVEQQSMQRALFDRKMAGLDLGYESAQRTNAMEASLFPGVQQLALGTQTQQLADQPAAAAKADFNRMVDTIGLTAKRATFTPEVVERLRVQQEQLGLDKAQSGQVVQEAQIRADAMIGLVNAMTPMNAAETLQKSGLAQVYDVVQQPGMEPMFRIKGNPDAPSMNLAQFRLYAARPDEALKLAMATTARQQHFENQKELYGQRDAASAERAAAAAAGRVKAMTPADIVKLASSMQVPVADVVKQLQAAERALYGVETPAPNPAPNPAPRGAPSVPSAYAPMLGDDTSWMYNPTIGAAL